VSATGFVEKLADAGKSLDDGLIGGNFAIEDAQRIGDGAALAIDAHLSDDRFKSFAESVVESGAIIGASDRVEFENPAFDSQAIEDRGEHLEDLGIAGGGFAAG
jgi:hypothetical protein